MEQEDQTYNSEGNLLFIKLLQENTKWPNRYGIRAEVIYLFTRVFAQGGPESAEENTTRQSDSHQNQGPLNN